MSDAPPTRSALDRLIGAVAAAAEAMRYHLGLVVGITVTAAAASIAAVLMVTPLYKADISLIAEPTALSNLPAAALGLAGALGLKGAPTESPDFYQQLLSTRPILDGLLRTQPIHPCGEPVGTTLLAMLGPSGRTVAESLFQARRKLSRRIDSDVDLRTGIITVSIKARCPPLAVELADSLYSALNEFNVQKRQTSAKLRRVYAQERVADADSSLAAAEDALETFMKRNRVMGSPALQLEHDRLARVVNMREDLAMSLHREYESARLEEVNTTPVLTLLQPAALPTRPAWPKRRLTVILTTALTFLVGSGIAVLRTLSAPLPQGASRTLVSWHEWWAERRTSWHRDGA